MSGAGRAIELETLRAAIDRPPRFAPHDAPFWDDPHISLGMLEAHLDPTTDAATRRPPIVAATVQHLVHALELRPASRLLDVGCGPGLYAIELATRGIRTSGIDLSASSIRHATAAARAAGLDIDYRVGDYTRDELRGPFDAAIMVYLDFGVLDDGALDRLLDGLRAALRPGALFAFDVCSRATPRVRDGRVTVELEAGGFWRSTPHLVIETTYRYGADVDLTQVAVVEPDGSITTYRIWQRSFTRDGLRRLLARHGFRLERCWSDLTGRPWVRRSPTLAVLARREGTHLPRA
jgi:cyclopropane fatty-acyl-phospholipid synthase-like methyltransferase